MLTENIQYVSKLSHKQAFPDKNKYSESFVDTICKHSQRSSVT